MKCFYIKALVFFWLLSFPGYIYSQNWGLNGNSILNTDFVGVTNGFDLVFKTTPSGTGNVTERLRITDQGMYGLGTSSPSGKWSSLSALNYHSSFPELRLSNTDSTSFSVFNTSGVNYIHSNSSLVLLLDSAAGNDFTVAKRNDNTIYNTSDATPLLRVKQDGMLYVKGLKVMVDSFPDFVFDNDYELLSLYDLKKYVVENKHLPGVPSASEVEDGLDVGQSQKIFLQKIEEMTLYIISLKEEIDQLKQAVKDKE